MASPVRGASLRESLKKSFSLPALSSGRGRSRKSPFELQQNLITVEVSKKRMVREVVGPGTVKLVGTEHLPFVVFERGCRYELPGAASQPRPGPLPSVSEIIRLARTEFNDVIDNLMIAKQMGQRIIPKKSRRRRKVSPSGHKPGSRDRKKASSRGSSRGSRASSARGSKSPNRRSPASQKGRSPSSRSHSPTTQKSASRLRDVESKLHHLETESKHKVEELEKGLAQIREKQLEEHRALAVAKAELEHERIERARFEKEAEGAAALQGRVTELEGQLAETRRGGALTAKQETEAQHQEELNKMRADLAAERSAHEHMKKQNAQQHKELEQEVEAKAILESRLAEAKAAHTKAAADLEAARTELSRLGKENQDTAKLAEDQKAAQAAMQERVSALQTKLTDKLTEAQKSLAAKTAELQKERAEKERLQKELETAGAAGQKEAQLAKKVADVEEKLKTLIEGRQKLSEEKKALESAKSQFEKERSDWEQKKGGQAAQAAQAAPAHSSEARGLERRSSLAAIPSHPTGAVPAISGDLAKKVEKACESVDKVVQQAGDAHYALVKDELTTLLVLQSGRGPPSSASSPIPAQRKAAAEAVQEELKKVQALREVVAARTDLSHDEQESLLFSVDLEIAQLQSELPHLQPTTSAVTGIPEEIRIALQEIAAGRQPSGGVRPMHWAAEHGRRDLVEFLLREPGGVQASNARDAHGRTPVFYADREGFEPLARLLRNRGSTENPCQPTFPRPPTLKVPQQYLPVLEQVETQGWHTVHWRDGFSMLHWAGEKGNVDLCEYLVRLNADLSARNGKNQTPLMAAEAANQSQAAAKLRLLEEEVQAALQKSPGSAASDAPTNTESEGEKEVGPSHEAIPEAYQQVLNQIESVGWEKMTWASNFTLLHWAAKHNMPRLCERLLWHGADPHHKDDNGRHALDYAREHKSQEAIAVLERGKPASQPQKQLQFSRAKQARLSVIAGPPP